MPDVIKIDRAGAVSIGKACIGRVVASIPGRCTLTRQLDPTGQRREFACRVTQISPDELTVVAPMCGILGQRVIMSLIEFGRVEGNICRTQQSGFVMTIDLPEAEREKFAAKIDWYDRHKNRGQPDNRRAKRIVPPDPYSTVLLADGSVVGALVIDMSVTGVAVAAELEPQIGEPLAIGKVVGRVVRRFAGGFAVQFIDPQNPQMLEKMLLAPPPRAQAAPANQGHAT